ncbi:unnamed protein product [Mytilus coruscus]|uniref:B box-type domain-containing protein n=1 Tax=Mytilus coruscus TaxID=42192 RepID=A0A6J8CK70_MYTCO|nr:unnamed protein product [Mytilus coruscus]
MASNSYCESCSEEGKPIAAIRFCSDCEERLCKEKNRNDNINESEKLESAVYEEVKNWKNHIIKQINTVVEKLEIDLSNCKKKNLDQVRKDNAKISELYDSVKEKEQELKFLKEHGSNNQLYLKLRKQRKGIKDVVKRVSEMTMSYKRTLLKFEKKAEIDLNSMGSIFEVKEACDIQYKPVKLQQAQVQLVRVESLLTLKKVKTNQLNLSDRLCLSDIAVTADNTLCLCNYDYGVCEIYVYRTYLDDLTYSSTLHLPSEPYGISILTGTDKAVVTLPHKSYVQFINTEHLKLDKTIRVGEGWYGITTTGDYIVVSNTKEIRILKKMGEILGTLQ